MPFGEPVAVELETVPWLANLASSDTMLGYSRPGHKMEGEQRTTVLKKNNTEEAALT